MAHRHLIPPFLLVVFACGGRESSNEAATTGTGSGGDDPVTSGTGGSIGTTSGGTGGSGVSGGAGINGGAGLNGGGGVNGGAGADWSACAGKDACLLESIGACGPGCEPVALSQFIAINRANDMAYTRAHPPAPCAAIACAPVPPETANLPNYYAACESGHCQPMDVRTTALSACTDNTDCYLRAGTSCCGCGNQNIIAVSKKVNVEEVFCASGPCAADCISAPFPPGLTAFCTAGHCRVYHAYPDASTF